MFTSVYEMYKLNQLYFSINFKLYILSKHLNSTIDVIEQTLWVNIQINNFKVYNM